MTRYPPGHPVEAYILVSVASGHEKKMRDTLREIPGVLEVTPLFGEFPLIVKVRCADEVALHAFLERLVYPLPGILQTRVMLIAPD